MTTFVQTQGRIGPPGPLAGSVANAAAVTSTEASSFPTGTVMYVATFRAFFVFDSASLLTVDSVTVLYATVNGVVSTVSTPGRWAREPLHVHPQWLSSYASGVHVNSSTGNDENDGLTTGTPLRTVGEVARRIGPRPDLAAAPQTITVIDDIALTTSILSVPADIGQAAATTLSSGTTLASTQNDVIADTSGGAFAIVLPPNPTDGHRVRIKDRKGTFSANNLTVTGSAGQKVESPSVLGTYSSAAGSQALTVSGVELAFRWSLADSTWFVEHTTGTPSPTPLSMDFNSFVTRRMVSGYWGAAGQTLRAKWKPFAGAINSYLDGWIGNVDGAAPSSQIDRHLFVAVSTNPITVTIEQAQLPNGVGSGTAVFTIYDTVSTTRVATKTVVLPAFGSGADVTLTYTTTPVSGRTYGVEILLNNTGLGTSTQCQILIGGVRVSQSGTGVFAGSFIRVAAEVDTLRDSVRQSFTQNTLGMMHNSLSRLAVKTDATLGAIEWWSSLNNETDQQASIGVVVQKRPWTSFAPGGNYNLLLMSQVTLPVGKKTVEAVTAYEENQFNNNGWIPLGTYLRAMYLATGSGQASAEVLADEPVESWVIIADSIGGYNANVPALGSWTALLRQRNLRITVDGAGSYSLADLWQSDRAIQQAVEQYRKVKPNGFWIQVGGNDCTHNTLSAQQSATLMGKLFDALHANFPNAEFVLQTSTTRTTIEGNANNFGQSLTSNYRPSWLQIAQARAPWLRFVDGLTILTSGDMTGGDGVHPPDAVHWKYAQFVGNYIETLRDTALVTAITTAPFLEVDFSVFINPSTGLPLGHMSAGSGATNAFKSGSGGHTYQRASDAMVQTSASTVDSTTGSDTALFGDDGSGWGCSLIIDPSSSGPLVTDKDDWSTANWNKASITATQGAGTAPDGSTCAQIKCTASGASLRSAAATISGSATKYVLSFWTKPATSGDVLTTAVWDAFTTPDGDLLASMYSIGGPSGAWARTVTGQFARPISAGTASYFSYPINYLLSPNIGTCFGWGAQVEPWYATEQIPVSGSRAAPFFKRQTYQNLSTISGTFSFEVVLKPKASSTSYGANTKIYLWYDDNGDYGSIDPSSNILTLSCNGQTVTSGSAITWSLGQGLRIFIQSGNNATTLFSYATSDAAGKVWNPTVQQTLTTVTSAWGRSSANLFLLSDNAGANVFACRLRYLAYWGLSPAKPVWA